MDDQPNKPKVQAGVSPTSGTAPPAQYRWRKGQSGNPAGRKPGGAYIQEHINSLIGGGATERVLRAILKDPNEDVARRAAAVRLLRMVENNDIADFSPLLEGKMTLTELRDSGVNTDGVKKLKQKSRIVPIGERYTEEVIERELELHDRSGPDFDRVMDRTLGRAGGGGGDWDDEDMYETDGQLESMLPSGVVPEMPADTLSKPDLTAAMKEQQKARPPDLRERERPGPGWRQ